MQPPFSPRQLMTSPEHQADSKVLVPAGSTPHELGDLVLQFIGDSRAGQWLRLSGTCCSIGSAPGCQLQLETSTVRGLHALFVRGLARTFLKAIARDTRLNGRPVQQAEVYPGDVVSIGPIDFQVLELHQAAQASLIDTSPGGRSQTHPPTLAEAENWQESYEVAAQERDEALLQKAGLSQDLADAQQQLAQQAERLAEQQKQLTSANEHAARLEQRLAELEQRLAEWSATENLVMNWQGLDGDDTFDGEDNRGEDREIGFASPVATGPSSATPEAGSDQAAAVAEVETGQTAESAAISPTDSTHAPTADLTQFPAMAAESVEPSGLAGTEAMPALDHDPLPELDRIYAEAIASVSAEHEVSPDMSQSTSELTPVSGSNDELAGGSDNGDNEAMLADGERPETGNSAPCWERDDCEDPACDGEASILDSGEAPVAGAVIVSGEPEGDSRLQQLREGLAELLQQPAETELACDTLGPPEAPFETLSDDSSSAADRIESEATAPAALESSSSDGTVPAATQIAMAEAAVNEAAVNEAADELCAETRDDGESAVVSQAVAEVQVGSQEEGEELSATAEDETSQRGTTLEIQASPGELTGEDSRTAEFAIESDSQPPLLTNSCDAIANVEESTPTAAAAVESANSCGEDDESIEAYMARLLERVRGEVEEEETSEAVETAVAPSRIPGGRGWRPGDPDRRGRASLADAFASEIAARQQQFQPVSEWKPREVPEAPESIAAMREVANSSARSAVAMSLHRRENSLAIVQLIGIIVCVFGGAVFLKLTESIISFTMLAAMGLWAMAAFLGLQSWHFYRSRQEAALSERDPFPSQQAKIGPEVPVIPSDEQEHTSHFHRGGPDSTPTLGSESHVPRNEPSLSN